MASTNPIWTETARAAQVAEAAKDEIASLELCQDLYEILELGASGSGANSSGTVGEIRNHLSELDLMAASVQFAAEQEQDPAAQAKLQYILRAKADVLATVDARVHFSGNGVEKKRCK